MTVLTSLPELSHLFTLQDWSQQLSQQGFSLNHRISLLEDAGMALGYLRAADLLAEQNPADSRIPTLLKQVYDHGDRHERLLALLAEQHGKLLRKTQRPSSGVREVESALLTLETEIQNLAVHPLRLEIEWRYFRVLRTAAFLLEDTEQLHRWGARLLMLAEISHDPVMLREARRIRMADLNRASRFSQMAALEIDDKDLSVLPNYSFAVFRPLIIGLMNLGAFPRIHQLTAQAPAELQQDSRIEAFQTWIHLYCGDVAYSQMPQVNFLDKYQWQIEALYLAGQADTTFPSLTQLQKNREAHQRVLELSSEQVSENTLLPDMMFNRWLRGRSQLALGRYDLAVHELRQLPEASREALVDRVLIAALKLDIAMSPATLSAEWVDSAANELRQVFQEGRTIPFADTAALRELVFRWHPQVAAYAALMPTPLDEFTPYIEDVMMVGERVIWRGKRVPSQLYPYLSRLSLRLPPLLARLSGNALAQINRLGNDERFQLPLWGPMISSLPLALCAWRHTPDDSTRALELLNTFGPGEMNSDSALEELIAQFRDPEKSLIDLLDRLRDIS